jgi:hypothetical protein
MKTDDVSFAKYVLAESDSPRIAAETFAQNAAEAGISLTKLQATVLRVLRYDDVVQVHGLASVVEDMSTELEQLADALVEFGCENHAAELRSIILKLGETSRDNADAIAELVREEADFDAATLRVTQDAEEVRRGVLKALRAVQE